MFSVRCATLLVLIPAVPLAAEQDSVASTESGPVSAATGRLDAAFDLFATQVSNQLEVQPVLVVWLFDTPESTQDRRLQLATRWRRFCRKRGSTGEKPRTAVVEIGKEPRFLTESPVRTPHAVSWAVKKIRENPAGNEYVFTTLTRSLQRWKDDAESHRLVAVIVTDQRGADFSLQAKEALELCRRHKVPVFCFGSAAPFGPVLNFEQLYPENPLVQRVIYNQGPETVLPQTVFVPRWSDSEKPPLQISSGYGSYHLARLCDATGGRFLIVRDEYRRVHDEEVMRRYRPDYRDVDVIEPEWSRNQALTAVIETTLFSRTKLPMPATRFPAGPDNVLRSRLLDAQKQAAIAELMGRRMVEGLQEAESDREKIEPPRWRAAYDLALGNAMALQVRATAFNIRLAEMKVKPKPVTEDNNAWCLVPGGNAFRNQALKKLESRTREILKRVVSEHAGTPFAHRAKEELARPFGWQWVQQRVNWTESDLKLEPIPVEPPRRRPKLVRRRRPEL